VSEGQRSVCGTEAQSFTVSLSAANIYLRRSRVQPHKPPPVTDKASRTDTGSQLRSDDSSSALQISRQHLGGCEIKAYSDVWSGRRLDGNRAP
jgi:hypothetical protein